MLSFGGPQRSLLIAFDISAIPRDDIIHKAVLRLTDMGYPRPEKEGKFASILSAYLATRAWNDDASWAETQRTPMKRLSNGKPDPSWKPEHPWQSAGGDFKSAAPVGTDARYDTGAGHLHEIDLTVALRVWHEGGAPAAHGRPRPERCPGHANHAAFRRAEKDCSGPHLRHT